LSKSSLRHRRTVSATLTFAFEGDVAVVVDFLLGLGAAAAGGWTWTAAGLRSGRCFDVPTGSDEDRCWRACEWAAAAEGLVIGASGFFSARDKAVVERRRMTLGGSMGAPPSVVAGST
jgi:hypothetical protein